MPLDERLAALPDAFVARYGDDLFVAHPDAAVVDAAVTAVETVLAARGLQLNPKKVVRALWNGAARPDDSGRPATAEVTFLGCRVHFSGGVGLTRAKARAFLGDVRTRIARSAALAGDAPREERARVACAAVAAALDVRSPFASAHAAALRNVVDDRRQLAELDHLIARAVAEALTGRRGARAFREVSWRALRRDAGLPSLVAQRNQGDRE
jgi:hypothetical protein